MLEQAILQSNPPGRRSCEHCPPDNWHGWEWCCESACWQVIEATLSVGSQKLIRFCRLCSQPIHPPTYLRWHQSTIMATHSVTWAANISVDKSSRGEGTTSGLDQSSWILPTHPHKSYIFHMISNAHRWMLPTVSKVGWLTCEWVDSQMGECHKSRLELVASGKSPNLDK